MDSESSAPDTSAGRELGCDPVDGRTLAESWRQRPGTPVYGAELDAGAIRALAAASPERPDALRAAG